jgi:hypothetical protein
MMTRIRSSSSILLGLALACALTTASLTPSQSQEPSTSPTPKAEQAGSTVAKSGASIQSLQKALSVTELKIEMAESSWKIKRTLRSLTELANALETYLNENCFGDILKTLSYSGPPTNPDCLARMDRLLDIYPDNPVATCLRDGIESQSCSDAYRGQSMKQFSASTSEEDAPDPALRVGLSAQDVQKLRAINETLGNINKDYQKASTDDEKQKHTDDAMHLYDQALSISCKIVALQLEEPTGGKKVDDEHSSIREIREKLLKIPPALRPEYQERLTTEAEEELAKAKGSPSDQKLILQKIEAIRNPEVDITPRTAGKLRYRVVLPQCYDLVGKASILVPNLPSPTCHRDGWQSPQCLVAVKKWHAYRGQIAERRRKSQQQAQPTPGSQISSF